MKYSLRWLPLSISVCVLFVSGCGASSTASTSSAPTVTLNVFAAASLTDAFNIIKTQFEHDHTNVSITYDFAGSQQLAQSIAQGAPADVFASANAAQMQSVITSGQVTQATDAVFAHNRLVVITPKANPGNIQTLHDLTRTGLTLVLADKSVPVGQYARDFLKKADADPTFSPTYDTDVLKNVVSYEQDVKSVETKVQLGEADAGIVYTTDAASGAAMLKQIAIPDALNVLASYPIAPIASSLHHAAALQFIAFVRSGTGQVVLTNYGFIAAS